MKLKKNNEINYYKKILEEERKNILKNIPKYSLDFIHIKNAKLLLNRREMLEKLDTQKTFVEIGVNKAEFSCLILEINKPKKLFLIDNYKKSEIQNSEKIAIENLNKISIKNTELKIINEDSIVSSKLFENKSIDYLYIDTNHSYNTTKKELLAYKDKISENGLIMGHDYTMGNWVTSFKYGVIEAVHEFCVVENWEIIFLTCDYTENLSFAIRKFK